MIRIAIFYVVLAMAYGYALRRGGGPERISGTMMVVAALATSLLPVIPGVTFFVLEWPRFTIDLVLLGGFLVVAALADRFWPIYVAAIHLLSVATHGVRVYDPHVLPIVYTRTVAWLAYPLILVFILGVQRSACRRRTGAQQFDWTFQRVRHARLLSIGSGDRTRAG